MSILSSLKNSPEALRLKDHQLLRSMKTKQLKKDQVAAILGQWYHPLHYFPNFLCRTIALAPHISAKTFISKIVWQELGEGKSANAHEVVFLDTMRSVDFDDRDLVSAAALPSTDALVSSFEEKSGASYVEALGCLYATEAADLTMVSSIGAAVSTLTGRAELPWVMIHMEQEPDHTQSVELALDLGLDGVAQQAVYKNAIDVFDIWANFFSGISQSIALTLEDASEFADSE